MKTKKKTAGNLEELNYHNDLIEFKQKEIGELSNIQSSYYYF